MRMTRQMGEDDPQLQKICWPPKRTSTRSSRAPMTAPRRALGQVGRGHRRQRRSEEAIGKRRNGRAARPAQIYSQSRAQRERRRSELEAPERESNQKDCNGGRPRNRNRFRHDQLARRLHAGRAAGGHSRRRRLEPGAVGRGDSPAPATAQVAEGHRWQRRSEYLATRPTASSTLQTPDGPRP